MKKDVIINGQNNKYLMKKVVNKDFKEPKPKKKIDDSIFYNDEFTQKLPEIINDLIEDRSNIKQHQFKSAIIKNIKCKINGYKNQDYKKKIYDEDNFVSLQNVLCLLKDQNLNCYYCNEECLLFYQFVRENKQWTLDRIDNQIGHITNNVILSCLHCNLKRKNTNKDKFFQASNLTIIKL